ncbi:MAG: hypothetical protein WCG28_02410 [bacterium]
MNSMKKILAVLAITVVVLVFWWVISEMILSPSVTAETSPATMEMATEQPTLVPLVVVPATEPMTQVASSEVTIITSMKPNFSDNPKIGDSNKVHSFGK